MRRRKLKKDEIIELMKSEIDVLSAFLGGGKKDLTKALKKQIELIKQVKNN